MAGNEHPAQDEQAAHDGLRMEQLYDGGRVTLHLAGDLDMYASRRLMETLRQVLDQPIAELQIKAVNLDFIDSAGLRSILWAQSQAHAKDIAFQVVAVSRAVERVIDLAGLREILLSPAA